MDEEARPGLAITATYDEKGRITVFDKGWERIDFVYDKAGALTEEIHNWMDGEETSPAAFQNRLLVRSGNESGRVIGMN